MKRVLITGAAGFIGKNLCAALKRISEIELLSFDLENTQEELVEYAARADFIFHLAGINRPRSSEEFDIGNTGFTEKLLKILTALKSKAPIVATSSTQALLDNPYGRSKKGAEDLLFDYEQKTGVPVYIYRLPNVFGKWCRPNYNSVVATFCHNIAHGLPIQINDPDIALSLVYIDEVVKEFISAFDENVNKDMKGFCSVESVYKVTLGELADIIYSFTKNRKTLVMPNLEDAFTRYLYATYLSYLPEDEFSYELTMKTDHRGWLTEIIKSESFGQIFVSHTKPGITRGNHWHHTKVEKFLVIEGEAAIKFRHIDSENVIVYKVSGDELRVLDIPPGYTHSITNTGEKELITLFWADEIFNPLKPDTYFLEV